MVAPVLVVRSSTMLKPALGARSVATLRLSWQNRLSQVNSAIVLRSFGPPRSGHSLRKEKTLATIVLSLGPVRKNHFSPFSVSVGEAQGWHVIGRPALSTTGCRIDVMPLVPSRVDPVDLVHRDQLLDDRARLLAAALIVPHDELDRARRPSPGNPLPGPSGTWMSGSRC